MKKILKQQKKWKALRRRKVSKRQKEFIDQVKLIHQIGQFKAEASTSPKVFDVYKECLQDCVLALEPLFDAMLKYNEN